MSKIKSLFKSFIPPLFLTFYRKKLSPYGFKGEYKTWQTAKNKSTGYEEKEILEKVKHAGLLVKRGAAAYERDSVVFDKVEYYWPSLACLMFIAAKNSGNLNVVDFGGSLGSSYFQNKAFFSQLNTIKWNVVEQPHFVDCGKKTFADDELKFFESIESAVANSDSSVLFLSSVLQYLPDPFTFVQEVLSKQNFKWILIDRMPLLEKTVSRITLQKVPKWICKSNYPAWLISKSKLCSMFEDKYQLVCDFKNEETIFGYDSWGFFYKSREI